MIISFLPQEKRKSHAPLMKICSSERRPKSSRLILSNVGFNSCSISKRDGFVNFATLTFVVSLFLMQVIGIITRH